MPAKANDKPDTNLGPLMDHVGTMFRFTDEKYPLRRLCTSNTERLVHDVGHSHQHMSKTTGRVGAQCEAAGHGGKMDIDALCDAAISSTINALNLANTLGMTPAELLEGIVKKLQENPANMPPVAVPLRPRGKTDFTDRVLERA